MKDLHISREQYAGNHDIVTDQGFGMHYRAISMAVSHLEVFGHQGRHICCIGLSYSNDIVNLTTLLPSSCFFAIF